EKITISKEIRYCKPLILNGLQKKSQKISTHILQVLTFIMKNMKFIRQKVMQKEGGIVKNE
ncbi:MAG: hypothetical protein ACLUG7_10450, partial [Lachnospiraceae bacterium]